MNRKKKHLISRGISAVLAATVTAGMLSGIPEADWTGRIAGQVMAAEDTELHNPVVVMNECDTVYFGRYWQEDTNGDGVADQNDEKTPIRWRILSRDGMMRM